MSLDLQPQFSHSVVSNCLRPHGLQHARPPCPLPTPRVYSNSCPLLVMPPNHLILCHPLLLPSIIPSIRVFSNESALCIRWPQYWSFSFSISPSNEYSGLISLRIGLIFLQSKGLSRVFNTTAELDRLRNPHPHLRLRQDSPVVACRFSCSLAGGILVS